MTDELTSGADNIMMGYQSVDEIHRSRDVSAFKTVLDCYPELVGDVEMADEWLSNDNNILLRKHDDYGMFTFEYPGVFTAHYFFSKARGKCALLLARQMLKAIFVDYGARSIQGMTPVWNRKANWITRQLGFTSYGEVETPEAGLCTHFIITIDEFFEKNKGKF